VCVAKAGDVYERGEKFGMIRFGSRTELYLPPDSEICVKIGDKVNGGETIIARTDTRRAESLQAAS
jgi:phosphatidylserine decarboxylase